MTKSKLILKPKKKPKLILKKKVYVPNKKKNIA